MKKLRFAVLVAVLGLFTMSCGDDFQELVVDEIQTNTETQKDLPDPDDEPE